MPGYINMKMYVLWVIKKHFWLFLPPRSDEINVKMNNKSDPRAVSLNLNSPWCCLAEFTMCLTWTDLDKETPDSSSMLCQLMSSLKSRTGLSSWTSLLTLNKCVSFDTKWLFCAVGKLLGSLYPFESEPALYTVWCTSNWNATVDHPAEFKSIHACESA